MCDELIAMQEKLNTDESSANNLLKSNGLNDCRVSAGFYHRKGQIVQELRLDGGSNESRVKAKRLLRHIKFQG